MPLFCHKPPNPEVCPICKRYCTDEWFRVAVDRSVDGNKPKKIRERFSLKLCKHLGMPTGQTLPCPECTRIVQVHVQSCSVHGECTVEKLIMGKKCCRICPDFVPED